MVVLCNVARCAPLGAAFGVLKRFGTRALTEYDASTATKQYGACQHPSGKGKAFLLNHM
jgi:hypothetical protein